MLALNEQRPALLKKCEELLSIWNQRAQRPADEALGLVEQRDETIVEAARETLRPIVTPEENAQQICRRANLFGRDIEDVTKEEVLGRVVSEDSGLLKRETEAAKWRLKEGKGLKPEGKKPGTDDAGPKGP